jgi:excisionase family DNA binding protein
MNTYLTIQEVMKTLKVSRTTVHTFLKSGKLKSTHVGRLVRIRADDLRAFMGEKKMGVQIPNRDSGGRFYPPGKMDAEQKIWHRQTEETNKLAQVYADVCEKIGHPGLVKFLDIKQYPETGHWRIGHRTATFFEGFVVGTTFIRREGKKKVGPIFELLKEAMAIETKISHLEDRHHRLMKQRR